MRGSATCDNLSSNFPFVSMFVSLFIVLINFLYLSEYSRVIFLSNHARSIALSLMTILSLVVTIWCAGGVKNFKKACSGLYLPMLIISFLLSCVVAYWHYLPGLTPHHDEIFRLSFAHAIKVKGLPPQQSWWVLNANGYANYYVLTEYFAATIHNFFENLLSLETIYLGLLPFFLKIGLGLVSAESFLQILSTKYARNRNELGFLIFLLVSLVLLGATPYTQGQHHFTYNQNQFGHLVILCVLTIIMYLNSFSLKRSISNILICLTGFLVCSLINVKILYYPPAVALVGSYLILCFVLKKYSFKVLFCFALFFALFTFLSLIVTGILKSNIDAVGGFSIQPLSLLRALGSNWLDPLFQNWIVSATCTFLIPYVFGFLGVFFLFKKFSIEHAPQKIIGFFPLFFAVFCSLAAGLMIRFRAETGGAEAYWLIFGWFLFPFLLTSWLLLVTPRTIGWNILCLIFVFMCGRSISSWFDVRPKLVSNYAMIPETCRALQSGIDELRTHNNRVVLLHGWLDSRLGWAVNGFCGIETVTVPGPSDTYGLVFKRSQKYRESIDLARASFGSMNFGATAENQLRIDEEKFVGIDYLLIVTGLVIPEFDWVSKCEKLPNSVLTKVCIL